MDESLKITTGICINKVFMLTLKNAEVCQYKQSKLCKRSENGATPYKNIFSEPKKVINNKINMQRILNK